jgi:polysaccharide biosynthesis/export protein
MRRWRELPRFICFAFWITLIPGSVAIAGDTRSNTADPSPESRYIIQANDILEVFIWQEPDLTRKVLVRPDGCVSIPLVQDMQAAGITPAELKVRLETKLKEFLPAPNVTIVVDAIQSYRIYVVGKVQKPGSITIEKPVTVLQALSLAGGFQDYAKESEIVIIRTNGKDSSVMDFNYRDVIHGKNSAQNILLRSGDVVAVP